MKDSIKFMYQTPDQLKLKRDQRKFTKENPCLVIEPHRISTNFGYDAQTKH